MKNFSHPGAPREDPYRGERKKVASYPRSALSSQLAPRPKQIRNNRVELSIPYKLHELDRRMQVIPRTKRKGARGSSSRNAHVFVAGCDALIFSSVASNSPSSIFIDPQMFQRCLAISAQYQLFRFTHLSIWLQPAIDLSTGVTQDYYCVGFTNDVSASIASITSVNLVKMCTPSATQSFIGGAGSINTTLDNPISWIHLSPKILIGDAALKWFKVVGDSGTNNWENYQGMLLLYNNQAATTSYVLQCTWRCEFAGPIPSVLTLFPQFKVNSSRKAKRLHPMPPTEEDIASAKSVLESRVKSKEVAFTLNDKEVLEELSKRFSSILSSDYAKSGGKEKRSSV